MNTITDNVANDNTEGFKQEKIAFKPFLNEINGSSIRGQICRLQRRRSKENWRVYDFAIMAMPFFTVTADQVDRYKGTVIQL
jgi:flagellar basal body rod protein FlgB